jgi:DNA sulfur modification protein DndC
LDPWVIGFSGGKDSTAVLKLVYTALLSARGHPRPVSVLYADTGVEIPIVADLVRKTMRRLSREARADGVPLTVKHAQPRLNDRFFVKVIGRGYPPPTNKFRWCTDRLRVSPVERVLKSHGSARTILLGVRSGESQQRDRTIRRHATSKYYLRQVGRSATRIFSPIIDYTLQDVWDTIHTVVRPKAVDSGNLGRLYRDASGECPIIRDPVGPPCGKGRFGCWTCTVVRRDRAVSSMVTHGHAELLHLLEWRNQLMAIREDPTCRCHFRRNGARGLGPLTLAARRKLLRSLLAVQRRVPWKLIRRDELEAIRLQWLADRHDPRYREI